MKKTKPVIEIRDIYVEGGIGKHTQHEGGQKAGADIVHGLALESNYNSLLSVCLCIIF